MDRLSRHTVAAVCSWPAVDRHHILAVANRDVRVAQQNLAELQLYVDDHAAHLANCASADDDEIALMSAELLPRLEGGNRVCDFAFKTQNAPCVSRFKCVLFSDRFQFAF